MTSGLKYPSRLNFTFGLKFECQCVLIQIVFCRLKTEECLTLKRGWLVQRALSQFEPIKIFLFKNWNSVIEIELTWCQGLEAVFLDTVYEKPRDLADEKNRMEPKCREKQRWESCNIWVSDTSWVTGSLSHRNSCHWGLLTELRLGQVPTTRRPD